MKLLIPVAVIFLNPLCLLRAQGFDYNVESADIHFRKSGGNVFVEVSVLYGPWGFDPPRAEISSVTNPPVPDSSNQFPFIAWLDFSGVSVGEGQPSVIREYDLGVLPDGTYGINLTAYTHMVLPEAYASHVEIIIDGSADNFSAWIADSGVPQAQRDAEDDADCDGTPNLVEYLFGTDPNSGSSKASLTPGIFTYDGQVYGAVSLPDFSSDVTDVAVTVEYSGDLVHWYTHGLVKHPAGGNSYIAPVPSPVFFRVSATAF